MNLRAAFLALSVFACGVACAAEPDYLAGLAPYRARESVSGTIRVWGNPYIPELIQAWEEGFRKQQPGVRFSTKLQGTEAAMAGLYGNTGDIVFVGREAYKAELAAFEEQFGYPPTEIRITSGSYATPHKTFALMVYVHKDNPVTRLTFRQLDALYSAERRRGAPASIKTWGELGATGEWANRPVHVYGYNFDTGMARFFRLTVLKDSYRWNPDMKEFDNGRDARGEVINAGTYVTQAVAGDPEGIGLANVMFENPGVKALALSEGDDGPFVLPSKEAAFRRAYPLTRYSSAFVNREPGKPLDPKLREFLRYILSRDGMEAVVKDGAFLPLNADVIREQLERIEHDLADLPPYQPESKVSGTIRIFGSDLAGLVAQWERAFATLHPRARFSNQFPSSDGAVGGMIAKVADLGPSGRELVLTEYLMFNETFGYDPQQVAVATGAFDRAGRSWAPVIYVHRDNPITQLTMQQLDGIFGAERSGGYNGLKWMPQYGRGAERNIRTWGDLGLTGDWAGKPIQTYGYAATGMSNFFQIKVFSGGDKWNPNYRQYVEAGTKMVSDGPVGETGSARHMLANELAKDRYGIAWSGVPQGAGIPELKILALAADPSGPYVYPTRETILDRSYPLTRSIFIYVNRPPGKALETNAREFMRFVLSREGQQIVARNGNYLPLTRAAVDSERAKVD